MIVELLAYADWIPIQYLAWATWPGLVLLPVAKARPSSVQRGVFDVGAPTVEPQAMPRDGERAADRTPYSKLCRDKRMNATETICDAH